MKTITNLERLIIEIKTGKPLMDVDIYALNEMKSEGVEIDKILYGNEYDEVILIPYSKNSQLRQAI